MKTLWKHQLYSYEKYKNREYFGLLFPTGKGKTLTACRIAEAKDLPVLIIAPDALCKQWADELTCKDEEDRISTKDWDVLLCTSRNRKTKRFKEALEKLCEE